MLEEKNNAPVPQPQLQTIDDGTKKMTVGVLKESNKDEKRVPLTPYAVQTLINDGHRVVMEKGCGLGANYSDEDFRKAGAQVVTHKTVLNQADILVKIGPLTINEIRELPSGKIIFSALHPNTQTKENIELLLRKNTTAIAYEFYEDQNGMNPFTYLMNEIIGSTSVMIAAELLSNVRGGKGIMLGGLTGLTPSTVMILGTDTAAEYAIRMALGLGAYVKIFDDDLSGLLRMKQLFGQHLFTSSFNRKTLFKAIKTADVIINSKIKRHDEPFIIAEQLVQLMRKGSVIVDMKIDSGSIIETSKPTNFDNPTYEIYDVIHFCVPNIPSRVARTASFAISDVLTPILMEICNEGGILPLLKKSSSLRNGTYAFLGMLTNIQLAERFNMDAKDLNLLVALF